MIGFFLHGVPRPLLHKRVWWHVDNIQASVTDKPHIWANDFCWKCARTSSGHLHTKEFRTADPQILPVEINNGE
jgi:hypothetical protein